MERKTQRYSYLLVVSDTCLMFLSIYISFIIRYRGFSFPGEATLRNHIIFFAFIQLLWVLFLILLDFYDVPTIKDFSEYMTRLAIFILLCLATGSIYFYLLPSSAVTPKTTLFIDVFVLATLITLTRLLVDWFLRIRGLYERVVFVGSQDELHEISTEKLEQNNYRIIKSISPDQIIKPSFLKESISSINPDFVVLGSELYQDKALADRSFSHLPLGINYMSFANFYEILYKKVPIDHINEMWLLKRVGGKLDLSVYSKRLFDIFFAFFGSILTLLLLPIVFILTEMTSRGPLFYKQARVGLNGKVFYLYKFRTMHPDAEVNGPQWAEEDDPRITSFGRFLRKTHIDEFPQFFNILKGNISFVGPRPERPAFVEMLEQEIPFYEIRYLVKPGLTGWAQINFDYGSSIIDAKEKLQYDLYYITHRTVSFDIGIIIKTVRHFF